MKSPNNALSAYLARQKRIRSANRRQGVKERRKLPKFAESRSFRALFWRIEAQGALCCAAMTISSTTAKLLLGPGPSNVNPAVLSAMAQPMIGHLDPAFLEILDRVQARLRRLFGTENAMTLPLSTTGSGGMEACFGNLIEPGDAVVIGVNGVFGNRMSDVASRLGANVTRVEAEWTSGWCPGKSAWTSSKR